MSIDGVQQEVHVQESMKLDADGYAELFSMRLMPPGEPMILLPMSPHNTVTWQGYEWESYGCGLSGYKRESSGEVSRPVFSVFNPNGLFSRYVHKGWCDNAEVIRYRVLGQHLTANLNSYVKNTWRVAKVASLTPGLASFELRGALDGQFFVLPGRAFYPPEFPHVSI